VEQRCPEAVYSNPYVAPYPLPDFVPHNQTMPDIYPGGWERAPCEGAVGLRRIGRQAGGRHAGRD
jgi:hypothetical protein